MSNFGAPQGIMPVKRNHGACTTLERSIYAACPLGKKPMRVPPRATRYAMEIEANTAKILKYLFRLTKLKKKTPTTTMRDIGQYFEAFAWIATGAMEKPIAIIVGPITTGDISFRITPTIRLYPIIERIMPPKIKAPLTCCITTEGPEAP